MKTPQALTATMIIPVALLLGVWAGGAQAATEGPSNTFYGTGAGSSTGGGGGTNDTFVGAYAGSANNTGYDNTFVGYGAGTANTSGNGNISLGYSAGVSNITGTRNVFLGYSAGYGETGSNKLYIDNCFGGSPCNPPFIYGEFNNHLLKINGAVGIAANGASKSQLHFSKDGSDVGGWFTSVLDNNFFMSSGATWDNAAGGWVQKSPDTNAVIAGSGGVGYRVFTNAGTPVGTSFVPTVRLHIDYGGNFGINTTAVAGVPIMTASGAQLTAGGVWQNSSSRERKEHIQALSGEQAMQALAGLKPVTYNYKVDAEEKHVGFIAEDVPDLVASKDRKTLSALDIVAVLTKAVQGQQQVIEEQRQAIEQLQKTVEQQQISELQHKVLQQQETLSALMVQVKVLQGAVQSGGLVRTASSLSR